MSERKENMKKVFVVVIIILCIVMVSGIGVGVYLSDKYLSGFAGMYGVAMLSRGDDYIPVSKNPVQYIAKRENLFDVITDLGDVNEACIEPGPSIYWSGSIMIDGAEHEYKIRAFTRDYVIITILEH